MDGTSWFPLFEREHGTEGASDTSLAPGPVRRATNSRRAERKQRSLPGLWSQDRIEWAAQPPPHPARISGRLGQELTAAGVT